jgi:hypothetical protein
MKNPAPWRAQLGLLKKRKRRKRRTRDCTGRNASYSIQHYSLPGKSFPPGEAGAGAGQGTRTPYPSYLNYISLGPFRLAYPYLYSYYNYPYYNYPYYSYQYPYAPFYHPGVLTGFPTTTTNVRESAAAATTTNCGCTATDINCLTTCYYNQYLRGLG